MAFEVPGLWHENNALHSAIEYRQMLAALIGRNGAPGIFEPGDLEVTQKAGGADGSVDIAIGGIALKGADASAPHQGWYFGWNNAVINKAIDPTGGGARVDYIVVADLDQEYGDASDGPDVFVVKGTEGAGAPNIPYVTYHVLARLDIPAGTSTITDSMITDTREYCELWRRPKATSRSNLSAETGLATSISSANVWFDVGNPATINDFDGDAATILAVADVSARHDTFDSLNAIEVRIRLSADGGATWFTGPSGGLQGFQRAGGDHIVARVRESHTSSSYRLNGEDVTGDIQAQIQARVTDADAVITTYVVTAMANDHRSNRPAGSSGQP